jgi:hypothetical protein
VGICTQFDEVISLAKNKISKLEGGEWDLIGFGRANWEG